MRPIFDCRNWSVVAILLAVVAAAGSASGESFPYRARVAVPGAPIHSGDGESFYVTDTLPEEQEVDVYRQKSNGWCAIRPPEESFSWVHSSHLKLLDDSLAEIDKDDVACRIGSRLSRHRNAVQVRLKKGEVVQILGEVNEGGKTWYKIAPPAGEFRWIHASCIRRMDAVPGVPAADVEHATGKALPPVVIETEPPRGVDAAVVTTVSTGDPPAASSTATANDWRAAPVAPPLANASPITPIPTTTEPPTTTSPPITPAPPVATASPFAASTPTTPAPADGTAPVPQSIGAVSDSLNRQLTDVELRLSRMVSEPPVTWQTEPLRREAEQLLTQAQSAAERIAVKSSVDKVDRFAAIQRRYQLVAGGVQRGPAAPGTQPASITPIPADNLSASGLTTPDGKQYDAVGILRPVVSKRPGAPQFALVDARGQVVSFVTATPDVNLQPYLGRRVGVVGNRGYIPEFQRAHVTAGRVMPLEEKIVR